MQISAIKETNISEQRVALSPESIKLFERLGFEVIIEEDAGALSGYTNNQYKNSGGKIVSRDKCLNADVILCLKMLNVFLFICNV